MWIGEAVRLVRLDVDGIQAVKLTRNPHPEGAAPCAANLQPQVVAGRAVRAEVIQLLDSRRVPLEVGAYLKPQAGVQLFGPAIGGKVEPRAPSAPGWVTTAHQALRVAPLNRGWRGQGSILVSHERHVAVLWVDPPRVPRGPCLVRQWRRAGRLVWPQRTRGCARR